jgi:hypothetical protein
MKYTLALPLLFLCSCFTTVQGYQTEREFNVQTPDLKVGIEYEKELSVGQASRFSIMDGLFAVGPSSQIRLLWFLRFGKKSEAYKDKGGASGFDLLDMLSSLAGVIDGGSMDDAAVYDALYSDQETEGAVRHHVLGFPMFWSEESNFVLFKLESVTVEGFRGEVTSSESSWQ